MTNTRNSAFSLDMQYSHSPLICKINCKGGDIVNSCRGEACLAPACAFPSAILNRWQGRAVICFVLPQANASRDFPRPVAVCRVVKEIGFFIRVVVQVK